MSNKGYYIDRQSKLDETAPIYSRRLAELMEEKNCSKLTLAKAINVSEGQIHNILYKKGYTPNFITMCAIATYFDVPIDYLSGRINVKTFNIDIQKISKYTGLTTEEIGLLNSITKQQTTDIKKIIADDISTAIHAILKNKHLLEIIGTYLTADYESEHGGAMETSDIILAYNKHSNKNEVINCRYLPFIYLRAIETELSKMRKSRGEKNVAE